MNLNFTNQEEVISERNNISVTYFKKIIKPTSEELRDHKEYLKKNLKKNFFN